MWGTGVRGDGGETGRIDGNGFGRFLVGPLSASAYGPLKLITSVDFFNSKNSKINDFIL